MRKLVVLMACAIVSLFGQEWVFNNGPEFPGASGKLEITKNSLRLLGSFPDKKGNYVAAFQWFKTPRNLGEVRFNVKSKARRFAVRFIGADGQYHQHFMELTGNGDIEQPFRIIPSGSMAHKWGGENDGVLRFPLKGFAFVQHRADYADAVNTEITFSKIEFEYVDLNQEGGLFVSDRQENSALLGWALNLGREFPGAQGNYLWNREESAIQLNVDMSKGGGYVASCLNLAPQANLAFVEYKVKTDATGMDVRFADSTNQTHQHYLKLTGNPEQWQTLKIPVKDSPNHHWGGPNDGVLRLPIRMITFSVHGRDFKTRKGSYLLKDVKLHTYDPMLVTHAKWKIQDPTTLFRRPDDKRPLQVVLANPQDAVGKTEYYLLDYDGGIVGEGIGELDMKQGTLTCPAPTSLGFHEIAYPKLGIRVGLSIDVPAPARPDEYFAVDTSFSWGGDPSDEPLMRAYLRIMKDNGILWNRDRISWGGMHPREGEPFRHLARFELYRRLAAEEGIKTLDTFHDTPSWLKDPNDANNNKYPHDLLKAGVAWSAILKRWPMVDALEVWNEPDISFANYYPSEYIGAFTKAVSRQAQLDGREAILVGGVYASIRPDTTFYPQQIANGMLDACDVISYHTYSTVPALEAMVDKSRRHELASGSLKAGIPHWITECGMPWRRGTPRALAPNDLHSASEIVAKAVEFRALGIERYFAFEYKYYDEHQNNFGMMDRYHTPMRSMNAYAHLARVLSHAEYVGDLKGVKNAIRTRTFMKDGQVIAFIYGGRGGKMPDAFLLPEGLEPIKATGLDGRAFEVNGNAIPARDGCAYVFLQPDASKFIDRDTVAMRNYRLAKEYKMRQRQVGDLVLQPDFEMNQVEYGTYGYDVPLDAQWKLKVLVNNFSNESLEFEPVWTLPKGFVFKQDPLADSRVPARGKLVLTGILTFNDDVKLDAFQFVTLKDKHDRALPMTMAVRPWRLDTAKIGGDWIDFSSPEQWQVWELGSMEPNIKAKFRTSVKNGQLIVSVLVDDPEHVNNESPLDAWRGDSIQFVIQKRDADGKRIGKDHKERTARNWQEFTVAKARDGEIVYRHIGDPKGILKKSKLKFQRIDNRQSLYEVTLDPAETGFDFSKPGVFGFSLVVNSNSGKGRDGYLFWGKGIADQKNSARFNLLRCE